MPKTQHVDAECAKDEETIQALDDVTLVFVMFGLNSEMEGAPNWGQTPRARIMRRQVFTEVACRWIPPEVFGAAFNRLMEGEEEDDDA